MAKYKISGVPVCDENGTLVGIITNRDLRFLPDYNVAIKDVMTRENLLTTREGTTLEEAKAILCKAKVEKLPIVDENFKLKGLITIKDIVKGFQISQFCKGCSRPPYLRCCYRYHCRRY